MAYKPKVCLDTVVLHELAHLVEPHHGQAFLRLLDHHLPDWPERRRLLNDLPLPHPS